MSSHMAPHGRGGAGNMADDTKSPRLTPTDLETPTVKTNIVTTGRGGSGNMAKNKDPRETRLRQDVEPVPRRSSHGAQHAGRGGAGNVFKEDDEAAFTELRRKKSNEQAVSDDRTPSPSANEATTKKGKGWFFGKK